MAALDRANRLLALSVSTAPRPLLLIELDRPNPLALHCLRRLAGADRDGAIGAAVHVAQALDADAVGRRFFERFRTTLTAVSSALPPRMPARDRHAAALLQLTRVLFLYFVQTRGWLDRRDHFLREELDLAMAGGRPLHRALFRPLFFGTLNLPADRRRSAATRFGRIPFLNGGLFEPHPLERLWRIDLPDELWRSAFDDLFERFHFTPDEGDPAAVAPDMLGRVFEGVMDPEDRAASGTFYTPAPLVQALVREGLVGYLAERVGCGDGEASRRLDDPDEEVREALDQVTVLDPAVGSGAFLLGVLQALETALGGPAPGLRRRILGRSLFGVDRNPAAVRLTELRLWLALIQAEETRDPDEVAPLPNLDATVRQGDSLFDPQLAPGGGRRRAALAGEARRLRRRLQSARGPDKKGVLVALRRTELRLVEDALATGRIGVERQIADLMAVSRSATLFGGTRGLDRRERTALLNLRQRRRFLLGLERRVARSGELPWFHYQSQFAEVFAGRGGFDLVVGNPPWVRAEALAAPVRAELAARYRWWSARGQRGFAHLPDLSVAFLERALELARPGGTVSFLLPAKLATAAYAAPARAALAAHATLRVLADLGADPRAQFEATVYPMAVVVTRAAPPPDHQIRLRLGADTGGGPRQRGLGAAPWVLVPDRVARALNQVAAGHPRLRDLVECHLGAKTGLNRVFLAPPATIEPELLAWAVRGRDVSAFAVRPRRRMIWTHGDDGAPLGRLPPGAAAHFRSHATTLRRRRDWNGGPEWTVFRARPAAAPHKVVWADLAAVLGAAPLTGPRSERLIPLNTCYLVPVADAASALRLAAWLNCTWIRAAAAAVADPAAGGFRRFNARAVGSLPLPAPMLGDPCLDDLARDGLAGTLRQGDLDDACARHLHLSPADRDVLAALVPAPGCRRR